MRPYGLFYGSRLLACRTQQLSAGNPPSCCRPRGSSLPPGASLSMVRLTAVSQNTRVVGENRGSCHLPRGASLLISPGRLSRRN